MVHHLHRCYHHFGCSGVGLYLIWIEGVESVDRANVYTSVGCLHCGIGNKDVAQQSVVDVEVHYLLVLRIFEQTVVGGNP